MTRAYAAVRCRRCHGLGNLNGEVHYFPAHRTDDLCPVCDGLGVRRTGAPRLAAVQPPSVETAQPLGRAS